MAKVRSRRAVERKPARSRAAVTRSAASKAAQKPAAASWPSYCSSVRYWATKYGESSSRAQSVAAKRPPGRVTRAVSLRAASRSGKNWAPCWQRTASKVASG
ncbi:hypothetical protein ASE41_14065 [Streptomyces sp. Root264]|nr:hypothetical protein ASE41_14065 [Streptomyces sp. Root264]